MSWYWYDVDMRFHLWVAIGAPLLFWFGTIVARLFSFRPDPRDTADLRAMRERYEAQVALRRQRYGW